MCVFLVGLYRYNVCICFYMYNVCIFGVHQENSISNKQTHIREYNIIFNSKL